MKKILVMALCAVLACGVLAGCGKEKNQDGGKDPSNQASMEQNGESKIPSDESEGLVQDQEAPVNMSGVNQVWDSFCDNFITLDHGLGNDNISDEMIENRLGGISLLKEDIPNSYISAVQIYGSRVYWLTDDEGEVVAGMCISSGRNDDKYGGKRQVYAMSYALAPTAIEGEDRMQKLDDLLDQTGTGSAQECNLGDIGGGEGVNVSCQLLGDGHVVYLVLPLDAPSSVTGNLSSWVSDILNAHMLIEAQE